MRSITEHPDGATLDPQDRAVYQFAAKVAADAASVDADDVERMRTAGLTDEEIADVVFAASARCFSPPSSTGSGPSSTSDRGGRSRRPS